MGLEHTTPSYVVSIFMVVFFCCMVGRVFGDLSTPQVPCYFIFGDSLVESGNNNKLPTIARANVPPYGVDFPGGATGRFTNGRTTADVLAQLLNFSTFIQPSANLSEQPSVSIREETMLRGLNYASAAGGIRNETGQHLGPQTSLDDQLKNHESIIQAMFKIFGPKEVISAWKYINKCLYTVGIGSNDYLNNYFMPQYYTTNQQYTPEKYSQVLIQQYSRQIKRLYDNGAKKIALWGVGPIGCTPFELVGSTANGRPPCVNNNINAAVQLFNKRIKLLADNLNNEFGSDVRVTYINVYDITLDILTNPSSYGFKIANEACCGVEKNSAQISCIPLETPCSNRTEYVFWDAFNPTEAANIIIAGRAYIARTPTDAYPWDIKTLLQQETNNSLIN